MIQTWSEDWNLKIWQVKTIWPVGASADETVGTTGTAVAPAPGVSVVPTGGSEKSNGEVGVGWSGAGENPARGVEAASVANRSIVGGASGAARFPTPKTTRVINIKKPQSKKSPAAIQRGRLFIFIPQL
jgi:hypothetical protein